MRTFSLKIIRAYILRDGRFSFVQIKIAMAEEERQPMTRDAGQTVQPDVQPQRQMPDTSYPRSVEGILRIIAAPVALTGIVLAAFGQSAGIFYIFVGIGYLIYIGLVFIVEVFVPGIYIHRLVDSIVCLCYCVLWLIAAIIVTVYAAQWDIPALAGASFLGYVLVVLTAASAFFAFRTWNKSKRAELEWYQQKYGSQAS
jgi:hypothetical protein